jgi:hypothetical protein
MNRNNRPAFFSPYPSSFTLPKAAPLAAICAGVAAPSFAAIFPADSLDARTAKGHN